MRFRHGLVVGKFAPLHLGHEHLIGTALASCDHVTLLSWTSPDLPGCTTGRRAAWLAARFPGCTRIVLTDRWLAERYAGTGGPVRLPRDDEPALVHRRLVARICLDLCPPLPDAVFTSESYGDGFAAELAASFDGWGCPGPVTHVSVDPGRHRVPISGTQLRADPHAHRRYLAPEVYADFVERIAFVGAESTGKSTLATRLAERLGTLHAEEVGRTLWEERGGVLHEDDLLRIARTHVRNEDAAAGRADRRLFVDTTPLTTAIYAALWHGRVDPELDTLADRRYDRLFLCLPDFSLVQDGTRADETFRAAQHARTVSELARRGFEAIPLTGPVEARIRKVEAVLGEPPIRGPG